MALPLSNEHQLNFQPAVFSINSSFFFQMERIAKTLFEACIEDDVPAVDIILDKFPELLETEDSSGNTPFLMASAHQSFGAMNQLIKLGANTKAVNSEGCTALIQSTKSRHSNFWVTTLILDNGGKSSINALDKSGRSALYLAASNNNMNVAWDLINNGANVNLRCGTEQKSFTPLMGAVEKKHEAMVNLLLENGSNPNLFNDDGKNMSKILP